MTQESHKIPDLSGHKFLGLTLLQWLTLEAIAGALLLAAFKHFSS